MRWAEPGARRVRCFHNTATFSLRLEATAERGHPCCAVPRLTQYSKHGRGPLERPLEPLARPSVADANQNQLRRRQSCPIKDHWLRWSEPLGTATASSARVQQSPTEKL
ncbi:unnamed protein product [Pleuronectes platessa]|uniref:Uncharacterized protein n=1 Tax=Pleuronectes platessa TaxID=8262 RepID=A0A9N7YHR9_PLEPL|nr:unnamed protein product [Pleuronectes platessa]